MDEERDSLIEARLEPIQAEMRTHALAGFDVETRIIDGSHRFMCGAVVDNDGGRVFWNREQMRDYLLGRRFRHHRIMATSLDFDFLMLFDGEDFARYQSDMNFRGSQLISVVVKDIQGGHGSRRFLDTMNFYPVGVAQLAKCIGMRKLDRPRAWLRLPKDDDERSEMERYNLQDARITYAWTEWFQSRLNSIGIEMKNTISSTSMWNWRRHYQKEPLAQPTRSVMDEQLNAYYGGRTECFFRGTLDRKSYLYDINSAYGWSMCLEFPRTSSIFFNGSPSVDDIMDFHGVTQVDVACPKGIFYPLLPYRDREGKLLFPTGRWKGAWYSNVELRRAIELGYRITPRKAWLYSESYFPFSVLQRRYYALRKSQPEMQLIYKLLGNSLYGKFSQSYDDVIEYRHISRFDDIPEDFVDIINDFVLVKVKKKPMPFVNPILSLYTAAYTRLRLHAFLTKLEGVYCDTDSVISERKIEGSQELGELKLERSMKQLVLVRPKVYFYDDDIVGSRVKAKGFRVTSKEHFDFLVDNGYLPQFRFTRFKESLLRGFRPMTQIDLDKRMNVEDTKRSWRVPFSRKSWSASEPVHLDR